MNTTWNFGEGRFERMKEMTTEKNIVLAQNKKGEQETRHDTTECMGLGPTLTLLSVAPCIHSSNGPEKRHVCLGVLFHIHWHHHHPPILQEKTFHSTVAFTITGIIWLRQRKFPVNCASYSANILDIYESRGIFIASILYRKAVIQFSFLFS